MRRTGHPVLALIGAIAIALPACSSSDNPGAGGAGGSSGAAGSGGYNTACQNDPRAMPYTAGIEQDGKNGALKITILDATPAPPGVGDNAWTIQVTDANGAPIDGATFSVKPWMPDHGHGSSITPQITPMSDGKYSVDMNLFMPGLWQITLDVTSAATTDSIVFDFCVQG